MAPQSVVVEALLTTYNLPLVSLGPVRSLVLVAEAWGVGLRKVHQGIWQ